MRYCAACNRCVSGYLRQQRCGREPVGVSNLRAPNGGRHWRGDIGADGADGGVQQLQNSQ